jgi:hypothetical protein
MHSYYRPQDNMDYLQRTKLYWYRDEEKLSDAFEPHYMVEALVRRDSNGKLLKNRKTISLGHLIFGEDMWKGALKKGGYVRKRVADPLTQMFRETGDFLSCFL